MRDGGASSKLLQMKAGKQMKVLGLRNQSKQSGKMQTDNKTSDQAYVLILEGQKPMPIANTSKSSSLLSLNLTSSASRASKLSRSCIEYELRWYGLNIFSFG